MKVLVGNKIYDSEDFLIAVYLTEKDFENIGNMDPECSIYCEYPDHLEVPVVQHSLDVFREAAETGEAL